MATRWSTLQATGNEITFENPWMTQAVGHAAPNSPSSLPYTLVAR